VDINTGAQRHQGLARTPGDTGKQHSEQGNGEDDQPEAVHRLTDGCENQHQGHQPAKQRQRIEKGQVDARYTPGRLPQQNCMQQQGRCGEAHRALFALCHGHSAAQACQQCQHCQAIKQYRG